MRCCARCPSCLWPTQIALRPPPVRPCGDYPVRWAVDGLLRPLPRLPVVDLDRFVPATGALCVMALQKGVLVVTYCLQVCNSPMAACVSKASNCDVVADCVTT